MSDKFSSNCSICQHSYDEGVIRQGLLLPCGHPFCRCCLQKLEDNCNKNCPMCRHDWSNARVSVLPEYTPVEGEVEVEEEEDDEDDEDEDTCKKHGFELMFWCQSCEVSTCKCCMKEGHKRCEWLILEDALDAVNGWVKQNAGSASSRLLAALEGVQKRRAKCSEELANMRYFKAAVEESERQLEAYSAKLASLESKMSKGVEELKRTGETADTLSIQALQRSKRRVEQLSKAVDLPQFPKLHMSTVAQAYKDLKGKHCGADFLSEFSSEVLKGSQVVEALRAEEEKAGTLQVEAETAAGVSSQSPAKAVKITAEMATQVEPEEVSSEDEDGGSGAPPPCSGELLQEGGDWDIADPDTAAAAITRLLTTRVRPSCLTLIVDASWHQLQVTNLLKVLGHKPCSVRLKFLDTFMLLEDEGGKKDEERLNALRFGDHKCIIEEYWGCLSSHKLTELLTSPALRTVALPLSSADDAKVLTALQRSHKKGGLSELHLHISKKLEVEQVTPLDVCQLKNLSRCYLHCPLVAGEDLNWLVEVLDKLIAAKGREICSVVLSLPLNSLTAADLDRLLGLLRDHSLTDVELHVDSNLNRSQELEISRHGRKYCHYILWHTRYGLPLKDDSPSAALSSSLARSTLPILVTLDQAKELLEMVFAYLQSSSWEQLIEKLLLCINDLPLPPEGCTTLTCMTCHNNVRSRFKAANLGHFAFYGTDEAIQIDKLMNLLHSLAPLVKALQPNLKRLSTSLATLLTPKAASVASVVH